MPDNGKLVKNNENYFLFHVKNSFRSLDIYIFVLTARNDLINRLYKKAKIILTFMTSQTGQ